jgi:hypothetical protein
MLLGQDAAKIDAKKRAPENAREYDQIDYYGGIHIQHHYIKLRYFELSNWTLYSDGNAKPLSGSSPQSIELSRGVCPEQPLDQIGCFGQPGPMDFTPMGSKVILGGIKKILQALLETLGLALQIIRVDRFVHFFVSGIRDLGLPLGGRDVFN